MSKDIQAQAIMMSLEPLYQKAEEEGLWFYHESKESGEIWASPSYLRHMQGKGRMVWSPEHWELRNPMGYLRRIHRQASDLIDEYNEMAEHMHIPKILLLEKQNMKPDEEYSEPQIVINEAPTAH